MNFSIALHRTTFALVSLILISGCGSITESGKVDYKTEGKTKVVPLDIPPDLSQLSRDTRYAVPGGAVTASSLGTRAADPVVASTAAKQVNDVRLERDGNQRWLVVNRPAEQVWPLVYSFWTENGFSYVIDQQQIGLLETEWAENRAKIPLDGIRYLLGKVLDGLYSSGQRDKFRTRIERNDAGGVDIFVTHRGMIEEYKDQTKTTTAWMPRPRDPELEAEFLSRLMIKLGVSKEQSAASTASSAPPAAKTTLAASQDGTVLNLPGSFDVTWRRVGLALDRTGFTVEDRDRAKGLYFVRYVDTGVKEEKGFLSKLFSGSAPEVGPLKYRVAVRNTGATSEVSVQNTDGSPAGKTPATEQILKLLADDLR